AADRDRQGSGPAGGGDHAHSQAPSLDPNQNGGSITSSSSRPACPSGLRFRPEEGDPNPSAVRHDPVQSPVLCRDGRGPASRRQRQSRPGALRPAGAGPGPPGQTRAPRSQTGDSSQPGDPGRFPDRMNERSQPDQFYSALGSSGLAGTAA